MVITSQGLEDTFPKAAIPPIVGGFLLGFGIWDMAGLDEAIARRSGRRGRQSLGFASIELQIRQREVFVGHCLCSGPVAQQGVSSEVPRLPGRPEARQRALT